MLRIVKQVRPRAVLIGNVRGILSTRFAPFRQKLTKDLDLMGFDTYWNMFNAVEFGVPQIRYRAFLVALRRGETKSLTWPVPNGQQTKTVGTTIGGLMAERGWRGVSAWMKKAASPAPTIVGGSHKHGGPDLGPTRARREWAR